MRAHVGVGVCTRAHVCVGVCVRAHVGVGVCVRAVELTLNAEELASTAVVMGPT